MGKQPILEVTGVRPPILDSNFLRKLEHLSLLWEKSFPGLIGGSLPSRYAGTGQDFLDHRQFYPGDDIRSVNWRAYLRFEKLFLKVFHLEPRVPVHLLLDASRSMASDGGSKFLYARQLAASLVYIGLVRLQSIHLRPFAERLQQGLVCAGGRHRFGPVMTFLSELAPLGRTSFRQLARDFLQANGQKGLVIVVSDFLDEADCRGPLQQIASAGHELLLIHLWAPEDRTPPWSGSLELVDAETGERMYVEIDQASRQLYQEAFDRFAQDLEQLARRSGGRYVSLPTSIPLEEAIFGRLRRRAGVG